MLNRFFACGCVVLMLAAGAKASVIYESASLGTTGQTSGDAVSGGSFATYLGARFAVTQSEQVTAVGGHLGEVNGDLFAAVISLSSATALPVGSPIASSELVADATFTAPSPSGDVSIPLTATLSPGEYALVFGSGQYGASGAGFMATDNTTEGTPSFIAWNGFTSSWSNSSATGLRFDVQGTANVPEPGGLGVLAIGSVALLGRRRFKRIIH